MSSKSKQDRKPKNQKGPSSAAAAQNFLLTQGDNFADAFSKFKQGGSAGLLNTNTQEASFDTVGDPVLRQNFKHLSKKDPTTRLKALNQIATSIAEMTSDAQQVIIMLPEWISAMKKLSIDISRKVREQAYITFKIVLQIVKKEIGPYLKQIMGPWLVAMNDVEKEVALAATNAFEAAFPPEKRKNALEYSKDDILVHIKENLFQHTLQTLSSQEMTETEAKERYTNILSSSFRTLVRLLEELTDKSNKNIIEICGNGALWKYLTNKDYPEIRAAAFKLVTACCKFNPELLLNENKQVQTTISLPVVGCFQETSSLVHADMIDALLSMLKTYAPEQVWGTAAKPLLSTTKAIFPRLFAFLRSPATSSPSVTFASMLPFLSFLNQEILGGADSKSENFFDSFFASLWTGFYSSSVQQVELPIVIQTFSECLMYALLQPTKFVTEQGVESFQKTLTDKFLIEKSIKYYFFKRDIKKEDQLAQGIARTVSKLLARPNLKNLNEHLLSAINTICVECINTTKIQPVEQKPKTFVSQEPIEGEKKEKEKVVVEEKLVCQDRSLLPKRLRQFLSSLKKESQGTDLTQVEQYAAKLFTSCIASGDAFQYQVAVALASQFSLAVLTTKEEVVAKIIPTFTSNPTSKDSLSLVAHAWTSFNETIEWNAIITTLQKFPDSLAFLIESVMNNNEKHPITQDQFDQLASSISERLQTDKAQFLPLLETLKFILIQQKLLSGAQVKNVVVALRDYMTSNLQDESATRCLGVLQPLIQHIFSTFQYADLRVFVVTELFPSICELSLREAFTVSTVSDAFKQECSVLAKQQQKTVTITLTAEEQAEEKASTQKDEDVTIGEDEDLEDFEELKTVQDYQTTVEGEHVFTAQSSFAVDSYEERKPIYSKVGQQAQEMWQLVVECLGKVSDDVRNEFVSAQVSKLLALLKTPTTKVSYLALSAFAVELAKLALTPEAVWSQLVLNESLWSEFSSAFNQVMKPIVLGSRVLLVPHIHDSNNAKIIDIVEQYSRFMCFAMACISKMNINTIFANESTVKHVWLFAEVLCSYQLLEILQPGAVKLIKNFVNNAFLPNALWLLKIETTESAADQGKHFASRMLQIMQFLLQKEQVSKQQRHYMAIKTLVQATLYHLKVAHTNENIAIATKYMRDLFKYVSSDYLFAKSMDVVLASNATEFHTIVDAFFTSYDESQTKLIDYVDQKLLADETISTTVENVLIWLASTSSLLLKVTDDMNKQTFKGEVSLSNLLTLQSALVILFNHFVGTDQDDIKISALVDIMRNFTNALMDSDFANDYMDQIEYIFSKLLLSIMKKCQVTQEIQVAQYDFIVTLIEQHFARSASALQSADLSFDAVQQLLHNMFNMTELAGTFLASLPYNVNQQVYERIHLQLLTAWTSLFQFYKQSTTLTRSFKRPLFNVIDKLAVIVQKIPEKVFTTLDNQAKQLFSNQLYAILSNEESVVSQVCAHDVLKCHQQSKPFLVITKQETKLGVMKQDIALYPALQDLLAKVPVSFPSQLRSKFIRQFADDNENNALYALSQSSTMLTYLLSWSLLFHVYRKATDEEQQALKATIKDEQWVKPLLDVAFSYVLASPSVPTQLVAPNLLVSDLLQTSANVVLQDSSITHESVTLFAAQIVYNAFRCLPSLSRTWFKNLTEKMAVELVQKFVIEKVSPLVIKDEINKIIANAQKLPSHITVKAGKQQVSAIYEQDEVALDIFLTIPNTYPLSPLEIKSSKRLGVSEAQWRKWILKMTTILFTQAGSVWDAILLWKSNLEKHFEGVEPCPICYSIVHTQDHQIPKVDCKVCHNKYHSACLYKWIQTSGNTSCPTCRSTNSFSTSH